VLPFKSMSSGQDIAHLGDGMCEEITTLLAQSPELRIAARTSAFQFRNTSQDVREIGQKLNVAYLLEGSVRRSGSRVRVTAQLIKAEDGYHVWSDSFDRHERDFVKIQDEVAGRITEVLKIRVTTPETYLARKPQHSAAYEAFLRAQYHYNRRTVKDTVAAIAAYQKTIKLDPDFAPAYCGLANAYFRRYILENASSLILIQKSFAAAKKAIELDDRLPDAHASMGNLYHRYQADWRASERELRRALELDPHHFDALRWYGSMLYSSGRSEEAIPFMREVHERDPLNSSISVELAHVYLYARRFDEAISEFDAALELQPGNAGALNGKWAALECAGRYREAAETMARWFDALPGRSQQATRTREAFRAGGMKAVYEYGIRYFTSEFEAGRHYGSAFIPAWYLTRLGRTTEALDWLDRGYRKDHSLPAIIFDVRFDPLRKEPRFIRLFRLYGGEDVPNPDSAAKQPRSPQGA
jgi:TolB-like protein/Tfp pilus assembly protein PilF